MKIDPVYSEELTRVRRLSVEEERRLGAAARAGDMEARARLIESGMKLVVRALRNFAPVRVHIDDLVQEGNLGLIQAAERFDPARGVRWSTWAGYYIRRRMHELCRDCGLIHRPKRFTDLIRIAHKSRQCLRRQLGREPSPREIVSEVEVYQSTRVAKDTDHMLRLATARLLVPSYVFTLDPIAAGRKTTQRV